MAVFFDSDYLSSDFLDADYFDTIGQSIIIQPTLSSPIGYFSSDYESPKYFDVDYFGLDGPSPPFIPPPPINFVNTEFIIFNGWPNQFLRF